MVQLAFVQFKEDDMTAVESTVNAGFIPVVHGDGVLDSAEGCSILSGDLIVRQLAKGLKPSFVVFLVSCPNASCACIFTLMPRVSFSIWRSE
jgi:isopentenyl phosphate kinase